MHKFEVSVSKFKPGLGLEDYGLDYITAILFMFHFCTFFGVSRFGANLWFPAPWPKVPLRHQTIWAVKSHSRALATFQI